MEQFVTFTVTVQRLLIIGDLRLCRLLAKLPVPVPVPCQSTVEALVQSRVNGQTASQLLKTVVYTQNPANECRDFATVRLDTAFFTGESLCDFRQLLLVLTVFSFHSLTILIAGFAGG
jgi:hypothetical protein